jgi:hypothetical protein
MSQKYNVGTSGRTPPRVDKMSIECNATAVENETEFRLRREGAYWGRRGVRSTHCDEVEGSGGGGECLKNWSWIGGLGFEVREKVFT